MQPFSDNFIDRWEHIIDGVNITDVPLECIKKIIIKLRGKKQRTVNLHALLKKGLDWEEIEHFVSRTLDDYGDSLLDVDFVLDLAAVAALVQPETDKLLEKLK